MQQVIAQEAKSADTEIWKPAPKVVTTSILNAPPSDAIILFDCKNLNEWKSVNDSNKAAGWTVGSGTFTVKKVPAISGQKEFLQIINFAP